MPDVAIPETPTSPKTPKPVKMTKEQVRERIAQIKEILAAGGMTAEDLNREGLSTPFQKAMDIDIKTGLKNTMGRIKMGFASSPQAALAEARKFAPDAKRLEDGRIVYRNSTTNRITTIDEEGTSLHDLADMIGQLPEVVGGTIGGIGGGGGWGFNWRTAGGWGGKGGRCGNGNSRRERR